MAMDAVILCLAFSVCHIRNKVCMCGRSIFHIISQPSLLFIGKEPTNTALRWEAQTSNEKVLLLYLYTTEPAYEGCI